MPVLDIQDLPLPRTPRKPKYECPSCGVDPIDRINIGPDERSWSFHRQGMKAVRAAQARSSIRVLHGRSRASTVSGPVVRLSTSERPIVGWACAYVRAPQSICFNERFMCTGQTYTVGLIDGDPAIAPVCAPCQAVVCPDESLRDPHDPADWEDCEVKDSWMEPVDCDPIYGSPSDPDVPEYPNYGRASTWDRFYADGSPAIVLGRGDAEADEAEGDPSDAYGSDDLPDSDLNCASCDGAGGNNIGAAYAKCKKACGDLKLQSSSLADCKTNYASNKELYPCKCHLKCVCGGRSVFAEGGKFFGITKCF